MSKPLQRSLFFFGPQSGVRSLNGIILCIGGMLWSGGVVCVVVVGNGESPFVTLSLGSGVVELCFSFCWVSACAPE